MTSSDGLPGEATAGAVDRSLDVLFALHTARKPRGVTELARALGRPKSSVHRGLAPLVRRGLVERDGRGRYRPGIALVALGLGVLEAEPVVTAARPVLERAADRLGETFFLVAARAGRLVVLEKAEGAGFLRAAPRVGSSVPVHATAVGKLYRALAPHLAVQDLRDGRERFTRRTLVSERALDRAAREAGERGWAANRDEWIPGLSVLAAPIEPGSGLAGAVALACASPRLDEIGEGAAARLVVAAAEEIAARLEGAVPLAQDATDRGPDPAAAAPGRTR